MEDCGGFKTQFTAVMENVLKTAVGEATELFERTLQQLRAELVHLKQENSDLKTGYSALQYKTRHTGDGGQITDHPRSPPTCDTAVQCEMPIMVERGCSPAPFGECPLHLRDITSDHFADLSSSAEDGNRQLALLLIKKEPQETDCDDYSPGYFLLKQEGAEPILVRKEPFKNTMEKVVIPSTFQTVTRCLGNTREISTTNTASTTNTTSTTNSTTNTVVSCSQRVDASKSRVTQITSSSSYRGLTSPSDTERKKTFASAKNSTFTEPRANSAQPSVPAVCLPVPTVTRSSKLGQMTTLRPHQTSVSLQSHQLPEPHTLLKTSQPQQLAQNIQHPSANVGPQQVRVPLPQHQNPVTDSCSSVHSLQAPNACVHAVPPLAQSSSQAIRPSLSTCKSVIPQVQDMIQLGRLADSRAKSPFLKDKSTISLSHAPIPLSQIASPPMQGLVPPLLGQVPPMQGSLPPIQVPFSPNQSSLPPIQGSLPPVQSLVRSLQSPVTPTQSLFTPIQSSLPPVQGPQPHVKGPLPSVQGPVPPLHVPILPAHTPVPSTQVFTQPNDLLPTHSQSLNQEAHFHNLTLSAQTPYPPTHVPFSQNILVQPTKSPGTPVSIPQTNVPSPLEQIPVTTSHYQILSDSLCSASDQFFSSPDNTSDLLQSLSPMPFHSPIVLTQQEAALEQPSMIHSQSSGQPLQLAPLLTLKEQQAAASSQVNASSRESTMPVEILSVNNFEEHIQRFPSCSNPAISCVGKESINMEMQNDDPTENEDNSPALMPGVRDQYKVLSKPEPNFRVLASTKEQQTFRMNIDNEPQMDCDISKQNQTGCESNSQVWEPNDSSGALPHLALSAPPPNRGRPFQRASRRMLEKSTECPECGRILSNASSLVNHMRLHRGERPYNCSQCGKAFPSVRGLNRHIKVHAEEKGYKCEDCGRSFVYQFTLTKHKLIHSGDRPYPCKVCGKKFLAKADRTTHMRMHTGEKPFFCGQCGKTFKHRVALNMHIQGHKGEKRYVCPHCDKGFVDLGNFKRHKRIHTGEKPFECKQCGKRFTQSAHLKKHINTQHAVPDPK